MQIFIFSGEGPIENRRAVIRRNSKIGQLLKLLGANNWKIVTLPDKPEVGAYLK